MNIADKLTILVSMYMFLTMPDPINPTKRIFNIHVIYKSNMAEHMAANMAPEYIRFIHKISNNGNRVTFLVPTYIFLTTFNQVKQ